MPILLLKVISLHILAVIQTAFPAPGTDLVAQGNLFCHRVFCHDLQGCLLQGNEKVTNIPLTSPRRCDYLTEQSGVGGTAHLRTLSAGLRKEMDAQVSPGVGTCHLLA